jgi:hypothetical protein
LAVLFQEKLQHPSTLRVVPKKIARITAGMKTSAETQHFFIDNNTKLESPAKYETR